MTVKCNNCLTADAEFHVKERYLVDNGTAQERLKAMCRECASEMSPDYVVDGAYPNYIFKIEPLSDTFEP